MCCFSVFRVFVQVCDIIHSSNIAFYFIFIISLACQYITFITHNFLSFPLIFFNTFLSEQGIMPCVLSVLCSIIWKCVPIHYYYFLACFICFLITVVFAVYFAIVPQTFWRPLFDVCLHLYCWCIVKNAIEFICITPIQGFHMLYHFLHIFDQSANAKRDLDLAPAYFYYHFYPYLYLYTCMRYIRNVI